MVKQGLKVYIETSVTVGNGRKIFHNDLMKFFDLIRAGVFNLLFNKVNIKVALNHLK